MTHSTSPQGILVVSHGSPRMEVNRRFEALVGRMAVRLGAAQVLPTFFSIARPNIADQVAVLAASGVRRVLLLPYFLYTGQHVTVDIPAILDECRRQYPDIEFQQLPTLEDEPLLEDVVVERLAALLPPDPVLLTDPTAIERRSYEIIDARLATIETDAPDIRAIIRRVVHATADFSFARTLRVHREAVSAGVRALESGRPIVCDVRMLQAGITRVPSEVLCAIGREDVADRARQLGCTRAAAAMEVLSAQIDGAIVAVGNAPTALWKILEMARTGGPRPALVVGLPVGMVGARESKQALLESDLVYVTNVGPRGGSPVAAAAVNALAGLVKRK